MHIHFKPSCWCNCHGDHDWWKMPLLWLWTSRNNFVNVLMHEDEIFRMEPNLHLNPNPNPNPILFLGFGLFTDFFLFLFEKLWISTVCMSHVIMHMFFIYFWHNEKNIVWNTEIKLCHFFCFNSFYYQTKYLLKNKYINRQSPLIYDSNQKKKMCLLKEWWGEVFETVNDLHGTPSSIGQFGKIKSLSKSLEHWHFNCNRYEKKSENNS